MLSDAEGMILNRNVVELLVTKNQNSRSICDFGGLPASWADFKLKDFEQMIRNLDTNQSGSISWRVLATCCILLNSTIASDQDIQSLQTSLDSSQNVISREEWVTKSKAWFEASQKSQDRDNSLGFPRVQYIKEALFYVHSSGGADIDARLYTNQLDICFQLLPSKPQAKFPEAKTYLDLLVGV